MILGFKTQIKGKLTNFVEKILACVIIAYADRFTPKIHSIRKGKRWKAGDTIHMATGVRTKNYFQFNKDIADLDKCKSVQDIEIRISHGVEAKYVPWANDVFIDGRELKPSEVITLAKNDGFNNREEFFTWFDKDFKGQIIHWTDFKY